MNPQQAGVDSVEVGEHHLVVVEGRIQYDKIWRCKHCRAERVDSEFFKEFDCSPHASVGKVRENSRRPGSVE